MCRLSRAFCLTLMTLACAGLSACSAPQTHVQTAARGTRIEARQVVAFLQDGKAEGDVSSLRYRGGALDGVLLQMHARQARLRPALRDGTLGNTAEGWLAVRVDSPDPSLAALVVQENADRARLFALIAEEVGHGHDTRTQWMGYTAQRFGMEWWQQAPRGTWWRDAAGRWQQRTAD